MKKKLMATIVALSFIQVTPVHAVYAGQYCKEKNLGNIVQKQKSKLPKPKYDTLQCQLSGKRYKWVKVSR